MWLGGLFLAKAIKRLIEKRDGVKNDGVEKILRALPKQIKNPHYCR